MKFTQSWRCTELLNKFCFKHKNKSNIHFLEIGAYEGKTTTLLADKFCNGENSSVDVIDPWEEYWDAPNIEQAYENFKYNIQNFDNINVYKGKSQDILPWIALRTTNRYDMIYIDGDHTEESTYMDLKFSYPLLKDGGVIIVDDYTDETLPGIKIGVDNWIKSQNLLAKGYPTPFKLFTGDRQFAIQK